MPEGGHWKPERVVVIEFPHIQSLKAWYNSSEYQPLITLRKQCTSEQDMLFVLEGRIDQGETRLFGRDNLGRSLLPTVGQAHHLIEKPLIIFFKSPQPVCVIRF
jgi:Domain of unknown function (DUF1330)